MSRTKLPLSQERIAPFDLEAFVNAATTLNQRTLETFTTPFPKGPDRWLSHYHFQPRPIEFTVEGEPERPGSLTGQLFLPLGNRPSVDQRGGLFKTIAKHVLRSHAGLHCIDDHLVLQLPLRSWKEKEAFALEIDIDGDGTL